MKKHSLPLFVLFAAFGSLVGAQTPAPKPASPLKQELNPNTDPKNQQTPAPASTPAPKKTASNPANSGTPAAAGRTGGPSSPPKESAKPAASAGSKPAAKAKPASASPQPAKVSEQQPAESTAAAAKRKLIADGYTAYQKHADFGMIYKKAATRKGEKSTYVYVDEDGIVTPIEASVLSGKETDTKKVAAPVKNEPMPLPTADRPVYRWISPFLGDWLSIQPGFISDLTLINTGYKNKTFQYNAYQYLPLPDYPDATAVYSWNMPKCPNCFIMFAEHEFSDAQLLSWGYSNKVFQFFGLKNRPKEGNFMAVSRWVNALPAGNGCRDYTLSVTEKEFTDAQLLSWGYTNKVVQFYVPAF